MSRVKMSMACVAPLGQEEHAEVVQGVEVLRFARWPAVEGPIIRLLPVAA
jgi:hypothetical protein